ncbi:hypothetical protein [Dongia deserti]|uniref:hypothetical protein n=1 Tax=Dongia deserti TaxID=2268030 RepID=UPI000E657B8F|nr:hypothetical protein [Dongia deserti]
MMRWSSLMLAVTTLAITGCVAPHPVYTPEFEPLPGNQFRYEAGADWLFQELDDPDAEARRLAKLQEYLNQNHYCLNGYTITERKPVVVDGSMHRIFYKGVCNR